ncbi:MAG: class I SAM-dependent methyltransferase [Dehalococcoidales bacterium]|jgi:ubiquinone/menaquinone biosynthesis C-methylase UbiE|nr:class I SAM-dependent methyltransferase [Dehalococcoidales bacterium]MDP7525619.1 class I SAM-dependent methyltransferase [Dehalococcoidales bacterium]
MTEMKKGKDIMAFWEQGPPMGFIGEDMSYERKREFRYSLQDYMNDTFKFDSFNGKLVLELGCGAGIDSAEFARNGASVVSSDFTQIATQSTKSLLEEAQLPAQVVRTDATSLPFKNDTFDCVYSFGVLHHIPDVERSLAEIARTLKPGGQVMVMLYNHDSLLYGYSIVYLRGIKDGLLEHSTMEEILDQYSERKEDNPHTLVYTKEEAKALFSQYFEVNSVEVRYNVIDLPQQRKVRVNLPNEYELGWHLIIKCQKPTKVRTQSEVRR